MTGLGLFISSFGLITRDLNLVMNLSTAILLYATGANIPLQHLPAFIRTFSKMLPLTRGISIARSIQSGSSLSSHYSSLLQELGLGLFYAAAGYVLFHFIERSARKRAVLEVF